VRKIWELLQVLPQPVLHHLPDKGQAVACFKSEYKWCNSSLYKYSVQPVWLLTGSILAGLGLQNSFSYAVMHMSHTGCTETSKAFTCVVIRLIAIDVKAFRLSIG
jgi:hypothetical protein